MYRLLYVAPFAYTYEVYPSTQTTELLGPITKHCLWVSLNIYNVSTQNPIQIIIKEMTIRTYLNLKAMPNYHPLNNNYRSNSSQIWQLTKETDKTGLSKNKYKACFELCTSQAYVATTTSPDRKVIWKYWQKRVPRINKKNTFLEPTHDIYMDWAKIYTNSSLIGGQHRWNDSYFEWYFPRN